MTKFEGRKYFVCWLNQSFTKKFEHFKPRVLTPYFHLIMFPEVNEKDKKHRNVINW